MGCRVADRGGRDVTPTSQRCGAASPPGSTLAMRPALREAWICWVVSVGT